MKKQHKIIAVCILALAIFLLSCFLCTDKDAKDVTTAAFTSSAPDFSPANESISYEEILLNEKYSQIYPCYNFEDMELVSSVNYLYDEIANPESEIFLKTVWENENREIVITVTERQGNEKAVNADDDGQYKLLGEPDIRYDEKKGEYNPKVYFNPEDITPEVIKYRIVDTEQGGYSQMSDISVLFDLYIVNYQYRSNEIEEKDIYELITSAKYFS